MSQRNAAALRAHLQRFIRDFGLLSSSETPCGKPIPASHAHALMVLLECRRRGESPRQSELAHELGIDKSNVARLCQSLESAGHLARSREEDDGRVRRLRLTDKGLALAEEVEQASQRRFAELYQRIPATERQAVLHALELLGVALGELGELERERATRPS